MQALPAACRPAQRVCCRPGLGAAPLAWQAPAGAGRPVLTTCARSKHLHTGICVSAGSLAPPKHSTLLPAPYSLRRTAVTAAPRQVSAEQRQHEQRAAHQQHAQILWLTPCVTTSWSRLHVTHTTQPDGGTRRLCPGQRGPGRVPQAGCRYVRAIMSLVWQQGRRHSHSTFRQHRTASCQEEKASRSTAGACQSGTPSATEELCAASLQIASRLLQRQNPAASWHLATREYRWGIWEHASRPCCPLGKQPDSSWQHCQGYRLEV